MSQGLLGAATQLGLQKRCLLQHSSTGTPPEGLTQLKQGQRGSPAAQEARCPGVAEGSALGPGGVNQGRPELDKMQAPPEVWIGPEEPTPVMLAGQGAQYPKNRALSSLEGKAESLG